MTKKDKTLLYHQRILGLIDMSLYKSNQFHLFLTILGKHVVRKISLNCILTCPYFSLQYYNPATGLYNLPKNFKFFSPEYDYVDMRTIDK